jgi:hypothetical protein
MQQDADWNVEKSVEPDSEVETTAIADDMRNLQGCEDIQKTDVIEWWATDDPAYCNTDLDDNEIILTVTHNAANDPEDRNRKLWLWHWGGIPKSHTFWK